MKVFSKKSIVKVGGKVVLPGENPVEIDVAFLGDVEYLVECIDGFDIVKEVKAKKESK